MIGQKETNIIFVSKVEPYDLYDAENADWNLGIQS